MDTLCAITAYIEQQMLARNATAERFFTREARRLACASRDMAQRFLRGGRLLAFGRGSYSTDAQHVAVEFIHPVIVGKRALPALDLSGQFSLSLKTLLRPEADIVMGFGPPDGDSEVTAVLHWASKQGAMTFALPGADGSYAVDAASDNPFVHQEIVEILYHTLWETVHVFLEHRELGHDLGTTEFLYPFLGKIRQDTDEALAEAAGSILMKVQDDAALRLKIAASHAEEIAGAVAAIDQRLRRGGQLIIFGNGGSATDANDWVLDCVLPPPNYRAVPAVSLSAEPASLTAIANDVGVELIFLRQMVAHGRSGDVAIAISTSGGSKNVIAALQEARKRGMLTIALLGYDGGEIVRQGLADFALVVPCDYIPRIQEVQASIYHIIREGLEVLHG